MKLNLLKLCLVALFLNSCAVEKPCTLIPEQAPELRGFKLGLSLPEVRQKFPDFPQPKELEYGKAIAKVYPWQVSEQNALKDIEIEFVDNRIVKIEVFYNDELKWKSADEFAQKTGEAMKLDGTWKKVGDDTSTSEWRAMSCRMLSVGLASKKGLPITCDFHL